VIAQRKRSACIRASFDGGRICVLLRISTTLVERSAASEGQEIASAAAGTISPKSDRPRWRPSLDRVVGRCSNCAALGRLLRVVRSPSSTARTAGVTDHRGCRFHSGCRTGPPVARGRYLQAGSRRSGRADGRSCLGRAVPYCCYRAQSPGRRGRLSASRARRRRRRGRGTCGTRQLRSEDAKRRERTLCWVAVSMVVAPG
jgi:hypothetical protein